ncbi:MAG: sulfotransferase [Planctomycetes bacterium]|nr:sulfotransferase [Planctomycetota bacterium]
MTTDTYPQTSGLGESRRNLPDFVVIGAMKAGTTSFHSYLDEHPEICMSRQKDVNFFSPRHAWDKGPAWYQTLFSDHSKLLGDTSAGYSQHPGVPNVPHNIASFNPSAKIIYLVRDPIRRILSHYSHNVAQGREKRSLDEALKNLNSNHYVNGSRYFMQLRQYLEFFDKSQILVLTSEALADQRAATLERAFRFLDVDDSFTSRTFEKVLHQTAKLRRNSVLGDVLDGIPLLRRLKSRIPFAGLRLTTPKLMQPLERRLAQSLQEDVSALETFTGEEYQSWTTFRNAIS